MAKTLLASLGMGLVLLAIKQCLISPIKILAVDIPVGVITFFIFAYMLKCSEIESIKQILWRKRVSVD